MYKQFMINSLEIAIWKFPDISRISMTMGTLYHESAFNKTARQHCTMVHLVLFMLVKNISGATRDTEIFINVSFCAKKGEKFTTSRRYTTNTTIRNKDIYKRLNKQRWAGVLGYTGRVRTLEKRVQMWHRWEMGAVCRSTACGKSSAQVEMRRPLIINYKKMQRFVWVASFLKWTIKASLLDFWFLLCHQVPPFPYSQSSPVQSSSQTLSSRDLWQYSKRLGVPYLRKKRSAPSVKMTHTNNMSGITTAAAPPLLLGSIKITSVSSCMTSSSVLLSSPP